MADPTQAEMDEHAKRVREKAMREAFLALGSLLGGPVDSDGNPMAIVTGLASDLVPTVPFGNVNLMVAVQRPAKNTDEAVHEMAQWVQREAQYIVGTERRLLQWAVDPSMRVQSPQEIQAMLAASVAQAEQPNGQQGADGSK